MEADVGERKRLEEVMQLILKITGRAEVKECSWPLEIGQPRETDSPLKLLPCPHTGFRISELPNYRIANVCCFKPLSLWLFVSVIIGNEYTLQLLIPHTCPISPHNTSSSNYIIYS